LRGRRRAVIIAAGFGLEFLIGALRVAMGFFGVGFLLFSASRGPSCSS